MKFHMLITLSSGGRHGRDPMVVGFTTSRAISGAVYSIQHFVKMTLTFSSKYIHR